MHIIESPQLIQTETLHYASLHLTVPRETIRTVMGPGVRKVFATLAEQNVSPVGAWFTHHLNRPDEFFDFEIGVPVSVPIEVSGEVKPGLWPSMKMARTVYHGDYDEGEFEGLGAAWAQFHAWVATRGYTTGSGLWEQYLVGPETSANPADWRTELSLPLIKE